MTSARRPGPSPRLRVHEWRDGAAHPREDRVTAEEPLEIRLAWPGRPARRLSTTMRTPGHDFALTAGFLHGEGVLGPHASLHTVAYCTDHTLRPDERFNVVTAELTGAPDADLPERYAGPTAGSSACGVCGKESIDDALAACGTGDLRERWADLRLSPEVVAALPDRLREAQRVFDSTGGLHAAGLFDADGTAVVVREDVGRHNAVDKVVGERVLAQEDPGLPLLCVSGRIGFELAQKAVAAGVAGIVAVGAPSSLAVDLARRAGLGMAGFVRDGRCVAYAEPARLGVCDP